MSLVVLALTAQPLARSPRQVLSALASVVWMTRLGTFLFLRIRKDGRDGRFDDFKTCWWAFLGVWSLQALWVTGIQLPVILLNTRADDVPFSVVDGVCVAAWALGFVLEFTADVEKFTFRADPANRNKFITSGLWRFSRHPNYFGEILMWTAQAGLATYMAASSGDVKMYAAWGSPILTAVLLLGASGVPMVEAAGMKKWGTDPAYLHYIKHTSCVIPWFPAKKGPAPKKTPAARAASPRRSKATD